jgi:hypothetical protein
VSESESDLRAIKRRISARVLRITGVSGVGLPGGRLTVYVQEDSTGVREEVEKVLRAHAPGVGHAIVPTGPFKPQRP